MAEMPKRARASRRLSANMQVPRGKPRKGVSKGLLYTQEARSFGFGEKAIKHSGHVLEVPPECSSSSSSALDPHDDFFSRFRQLHEISAFIDDLAARYPKHVVVRTIGQSVQGRPIRAVVVHGGRVVAPEESPPRNSLLMLGTVHGREWISTSSVLYSLRGLVEGLSKGEHWATTLLNSVTIHSIPVVNPDGYEYTFSDADPHKKGRWSKGKELFTTMEARYWRKNMRANQDGTLGVDLNRNFGSSGEDVWGRDTTRKSSYLPSADIFQGTQGFSEPETALVRDYANMLSDRFGKRDRDSVLTKQMGFGRLTAIYDVHCCIGAILAPFSPKPVSEQHRQAINAIGNKVIQAINDAGKGVTHYAAGSGAPGQYYWRERHKDDPGSGISSTWGFHEQRVNLTLVVETRGKFVMSCTEIVPIGKEVMAGLVELSAHAAVDQPYDWDARPPWPPGSAGESSTGGGGLTGLFSIRGAMYSSSAQDDDRRTQPLFNISFMFVALLLAVAAAVLRQKLTRRWRETRRECIVASKTNKL